MKRKRSLMSIVMATLVVVSLCAVYASASVSAADGGSSRASVQAAPDLVGAPIAPGSGPAACVLQGSNDMYVFVKGNDSALWYRIWSTTRYSWVGAWTPLGGQLSSSPAAVSRQPGVIDVYVRSVDGSVYEKAYSAGAWHNYLKIGGATAPKTSPAASGWPGREDVFVEGMDGALYQKTWTAGGGWSGWINLGGGLTSSPAAVSRQTGVTDVYVRGKSGAIWQHNNGFGWTSRGEQVAANSGPAVCSYGADREDLFWQNTSGALEQKTWTTANGWSIRTNLGGKLTSSPTAASFTYNSAIDIEVFVRGGTGFLYIKEFYSPNQDSAGQWHTWTGPYDGPP